MENTYYYENLNLSKIWTPTPWELKKLILNSYKEEICHPRYQSANNGQFIPYDSSINSFLFKLTRRCNGLRYPAINFMEEDATVLYSMLKKDGFFGTDSENGNCAVCATEKLERNVVKQMQKEIEITKMARNYFTQMKNAKYFKLCCKHRPFDPKDTLPKCNFGCQLSMHHVPILPVQNHLELVMFRDSFVPIPQGENPNKYMELFFEWVDYFNSTDTSNEYFRMPYTKNIRGKLEKRVERKITGRLF